VVVVEQEIWQVAEVLVVLFNQIPALLVVKPLPLLSVQAELVILLEEITVLLQQRLVLPHL
jgi:hypothetical protein